MAMNEDGEFELVLGNKQLFSLFFIVVILLGVCFLMGYVVGKNSAPPLNAAVAPQGEREALVIPPAAPAPPSAETTPQDSPDASAPAAAAPAKPEPVPTPQPPEASAKSKTLPPFQPEPAARAGISAKRTPLVSQPIPGRVYLQLSATDRDSAEGMADLLRGRGFAAIAAQVPERPELFRVLVGPLEESEIAKTRADLKAKNFPSEEAVRRVFE